MYVLLLLAAGCAPSALLDPGLEPRASLAGEPVVIEAFDAVPAEAEATLVLKLEDHVIGRIDADGLVRSEVGADLSVVRRRLDAAGARVHPLFDDEAAVADLLDRAARRSGRAQPDLLGMVQVDVEGDRAALVALAEALDAAPGVEFAELTFRVPPPADIAPTTSDYEANQGYLQADPGIDAVAAWARGITGTGIHLADCEYDFDAEHEDLVDVGITESPDHTGYLYGDHGTATLGEILAPDNGYGTTGIAHGATASFHTEYSVEAGGRRTASIAEACAGSAAGDVVMLEMQAYGADGSYAPAEYDRSVWGVVKACTDAGVVVTAAAGNGAADLDSGSYARYRLRGDSGAILVGAGSASTAHDRLSFSTYGERVNVQGWGESVFTLGYGGYARVGGDAHQTYTSTFNGTSSATPIVTGATLLLQSAAEGWFGVRMEPAAVRELLVTTGIPQGSASASAPIGPLPDLDAALDALQTDADGDGWSVWVGDCDDTNSRRHPGVLRDRIGDGIDADCNGFDG